MTEQEFYKRFEQISDKLENFMETLLKGFTDEVLSKRKEIEEIDLENYAKITEVRNKADMLAAENVYQNELLENEKILLERARIQSELENISKASGISIEKLKKQKD